MSKAIVDLESKATLNKTDVLLLTDAAGNMAKMTTAVFRNQIGGNTLTVGTNTVSPTATSSSFVVGGLDEKTASIVLSSYGGASFDTKKKGSLFSVSDVLTIKDGLISIKGKTIDLSPEGSIFVKLKGKGVFGINDDFTVSDDGVTCTKFQCNAITTKALTVKSGSDSVSISSDDGEFSLSANSKNTKKEIKPFINLKGTSKSFQVELNQKAVVAISETALSVVGSVDAKTLSGELKTSLISGQNITLSANGTVAFNVSGQNADINFKSNIKFDGLTTLATIDSAKRDDITVEPGTICYNSSKRIFEGYNGKAWVKLG